MVDRTTIFSFILFVGFWHCFFVWFLLNGNIFLAILVTRVLATCAYVAALMGRLQQKGIKAVLLSGDREEAVATIAKTVGMGSDCINASLTPQRKSEIISTLKSAGHRVAMVTIFNQIHYFSRINMNIENLQWLNRSFMLAILIFSINCSH